MGCATSKKASPRCRHCHNDNPSPVITRRSYSMHVHHPPPQTKTDSYHLVALTSSTLGSLTDKEKIEYEFKTLVNDHYKDHTFHKLIEKENVNVDGSGKEFSMGLIEAKTWSSMIEEKIPKMVPKTPTRTPPGEPEMIDAWELMEGLEDISPLRNTGQHFRSFSFDVVKSPCPVNVTSCVDDRPKSRLHQENEAAELPKPMWLELADHENHFDPDVITDFRKSFDSRKEVDPIHFEDGDESTEDVSFHFDRRNEDPDEVDSLHSSDEESCILSDEKCEVPIGKAKGMEKFVLYFTSLRGVRKTYEDCCHVRVILKSLGVRVDERDMSMHSGFKDELKELVKDGSNGVSLPKVFVGERCIGGADEIRRMHEDGKLEKLLESCEKLDDGDGNAGGVCEACGDIRFVPCETCSGSCKIYYEDDHVPKEGRERDEEKAATEGDCGFQRCPDCNENGLTRCPICCY